MILFHNSFPIFFTVSRQSVPTLIVSHLATTHHQKRICILLPSLVSTQIEIRSTCFPLKRHPNTPTSLRLLAARAVAVVQKGTSQSPARPSLLDTSSKWATSAPVSPGSTLRHHRRCSIICTNSFSRNC